MINRLTNSVFSSAIKYTNNELKQNSKAYQHSNSLYNRLYLRYLSIVIILLEKLSSIEFIFNSIEIASKVLG